jgi:hypothetical protein
MVGAALLVWNFFIDCRADSNGNFLHAFTLAMKGRVCAK